MAKLTHYNNTQYILNSVGYISHLNFSYTTFPGY